MVPHSPLSIEPPQYTLLHFRIVNRKNDVTNPDSRAYNIFVDVEDAKDKIYAYNYHN